MDAGRQGGAGSRQDVDAHASERDGGTQMTPVGRDLVESVAKSLFPDVPLTDIAWVQINPSVVSAKVYLQDATGSKYMDPKTNQPACMVYKRRIA